MTCALSLRVIAKDYDVREHASRIRYSQLIGKQSYLGRRFLRAHHLAIPQASLLPRPESLWVHLRPSRLACSPLGRRFCRYHSVSSKDQPALPTQQSQMCTRKLRAVQPI